MTDTDLDQTDPIIPPHERGSLADVRRLYREGAETRGYPADWDIARHDGWTAVQDDLAWSIAWDVANNIEPSVAEVTLWRKISNHI